MGRKVSVSVKDAEDPLEELRYWAQKTAEERVDAVSLLRRQCFIVMGYSELPRLTREVRVLPTHEP